MNSSRTCWVRLTILTQTLPIDQQQNTSSSERHDKYQIQEIYQTANLQIRAKYHIQMPVDLVESGQCLQHWMGAFSQESRQVQVLSLLDVHNDRASSKYLGAAENNMQRKWPTGGYLAWITAKISWKYDILVTHQGQRMPNARMAYP